MADNNEVKDKTKKEGEEAPKKKKYATVIRPQNSKGGMVRPAPGQRPAGAGAKKPVRVRPEGEKLVKKPRPEKAEEAAKTEEVQEAVQDTEAAAVVEQFEAPEKAVETPAVSASSEKTEETAQAAEEAFQEEKTEEAAPESSSPVMQALKQGRFVNMDAVRAASQKPVKPVGRSAVKGGPRPAGTGKPQIGRGPAQEGRPAAGRPGQGGKGPGTGRPGMRSGAGQGPVPFDKDAAAAARPGARPARPGAARGGAAKSGAAAMDYSNKNNSKAPNKKERETREKSKQYGTGVKREENFRNLNKQKSVVRKEAEPVKEEVIKTLVLPDTITLGDLAAKMKQPAAALIKKLFLKGQMFTINSDLTYEQAEEIALDYEILCEREIKVNIIEEMLKDTEDPEETLKSRPPVVCVMGHVDHGKTSLLDSIRNTHVIDREAGGITQHIGAYMVTIEVGGEPRQITFLDTPGHEAFTAMRMRGAQATDIAILVVAADDGVMPQTVEAINHAKAAGVDIIVAVNKIDKPNANVDRVKQELTEYGLVPEDWGGDTTFAPISAKTGEGLDELLEMVVLDADVKELKANPDRLARGLVIEAKLDKGKGPVATILVQKGTLKVGDNVAVGSCYGKVRAMMDDKGQKVEEATPSTPVEILGLNDVPNAGEIFMSMKSDKDARNFAETFIAEDREKLLEKTKAKLTLEGMYNQIKEGNLKQLNLVVKADVQGSVEAVRQSLEKLTNDEVVVHVIHSGVGAITESDVTLASASNAIIIGFNVRPDATAKSIADRENVDIKLYRIIYQAIADIEMAMQGMLEPVYEEKVIGHAEIRQLFKASGIGVIAGSYVKDGKIERGCMIRIHRGEELIYEGNLASVKRFKDDVKEVKEGYECGLVFEKFNDFDIEDMVEAYVMQEVPRS